MPEVNITSASDEELEDVIRRVENTHVSGSLHERATIELDIRRKRKLYELQKNILTTFKTRLDRIIKLLEYIGKKPLRAVVIAALVAVGIGVLISLLSEILLTLFYSLFSSLIEFG